MHLIGITDEIDLYPTLRAARKDNNHRAERSRQSGLSTGCRSLVSSSTGIFHDDGRHIHLGWEKSMTAPGEWIHIADHAWEMHTPGAQYTLHQENDRWIARSFALSHTGGTTKDAEQSAPTIDQAKAIVDRWQSRQAE